MGRALSETDNARLVSRRHEDLTQTTLDRAVSVERLAND